MFIHVSIVGTMRTKQLRHKKINISPIFLHKKQIGTGIVQQYKKGMLIIVIIYMEFEKLPT